MFLPLIYIGVIWFLFNRYKKNHQEIQEKIKPCLEWAKAQGFPIPTKPNLIEMFLIENRYYWYLRFPFGLIVPFLPITKKVHFYKQEINNLWERWEREGRPGKQ